MYYNRQNKLGLVIAATLLALVFAVPGWAQGYFHSPDYNGAFPLQNGTNGYGDVATVYDRLFGLDANYQGLFGNRTLQGSHLAFALSRNPALITPGPGTLFVLGAGLLGLAAFIRRKMAER